MFVAAFILFYFTCVRAATALYIWRLGKSVNWWKEHGYLVHG